MEGSGINPFERKDAIIEALLEHAYSVEKTEELGTDGEDIRRFIEVFYAHASPDDVIDQEPKTLYAIASHMWKMGKERRPGKPKVQVFNPRSMKGGWQTQHTAIAIVNDDMPFLLDSITGSLVVAHRYMVHAVHHPILLIERDDKGVRQRILGAVDYERGETQGKGRESYMYLEIDAQSDPDTLKDIQALIESVLGDVRTAVGDWRAMTAKIDETVASLTVNPPPTSLGHQDETIRFLRWLGDDHFTFIGYREYRFDGKEESGGFRAVDSSGLGILRDPERYILRGPRGLTAISAEIQHFLTLPEKPVIITKANVKATVHRPVHMDYVGVKIYDGAGKVIGERRFAGLFTSQAYSESPFETPLLRRKVENVQRRALFDKRSHAGKALRHILETFPRDELFQIEEDRLLQTSLGILHLLERPRPRAFIRRDPFERFVSVLVYVPRDVYHSGLRAAVAKILCDAFNGEVSVYYAQLSEDVMARWHFIIRTRPGEVTDADEADIDRQIAEAVKGWTERLREQLIESRGEEKGIRLFNHYGDIFSLGYREDFKPAHAVRDITKLEELSGPDGIGIHLYKRDEDDACAMHLKMYHGSQIVPLSECLPMLEHLGLRVISEHAYELEREAGGCIHDFYLHKAGGDIIDLNTLKPLVEDLLVRVWAGEVEDDSYNSLVVETGLDWRKTTILRLYGRYLRQLGLPFGQVYVARCLRDHPAIAKDLFALFEARFDPDFATSKKARTSAIDGINERLGEGLDAVVTLDDDRILRTFINLIQSTVRTNYYQSFHPGIEGGPVKGLAVKLRSRDVEEAPLPKPWREIFVYSPRVEGVHLRWGPVARGGLRWSDRRQDFRTEVLGLVKAQQVKNAVIVPVGAKGGFVPKHLPMQGAREEIQEEAIACYKSFIKSLLSITDNLVEGDIKRPEKTICHDGDDPYLVVAADKGTATFSDIANKIATEGGFWLGDAFASGGSQGYDHKAMGITARGAWVSVQRHFREIGIDVQKDPISVIGVGDMSGDVFGNGMLLSKTIRLKAAFDHRHIFLDPDPDAKESFAERKRLFNLARSSWADYDEKKISKGGGIWPRSAKSIPLSPEIQAFLGIEKKALTPAQLIHEILKAEVDLLWFGGIGTYVKSSEESHVAVGDRSNDTLRIDADELRVKVVGEGANLGMTQRGRIEFSRNGGRLNTDFIDNSAGVDCSDKEVNIKILLADALAKGLISREERDELLAEMTEKVAEIVLYDTYLQTQAISLAKAQAAAARESHAGLIRTLEREGTLNRDIEFLPSDEQFSELALAQRGLTRPELAVLMSYAKLSLKAILMNSPLLDNPYLQPELKAGFPDAICNRFSDELNAHRLRRELVATSLVNEVVGRAGLSFVYEVREETGLGVDQIIGAFLLVRDIFGISDLWPAIEAMDHKMPATIQTLMHLELSNFIKQQAIWFLRNEERPFEMDRIINAYQGGVAKLLEKPHTVLSPIALENYKTKRSMYEEQGAPKKLAKQVAALQMLGFVCDVEKVSNTLDRTVDDVAQAWSEVGHRIGFDWLRQTSGLISADDHWDRLAARAVLDDLADQQRELTRHILKSHPDLEGVKAVSTWIDADELTGPRSERLLSDLKSSGPLSVAKLSFAARHLRSILMRALEY